MAKDYSVPQEIKSLNARIREKQEAKAPLRGAALAKLPAGIQVWVNSIVEHAMSRSLWKDPKDADVPAAWALAAIQYLVEHEQPSFAADLKAALAKRSAGV